MTDVPVSPEDKAFKDENSNQSKSPKGKMPDFIYIDDTQEFLHGGYVKPESIEEPKFQKPLAIQSSFSLRFLCFFGMLLSFIVAVGSLLWTTIVFVCAALLLFQHQSLNQYLRNWWSFYINSSIVSLGLGIACLSPMLGFGLLLIYFSIKTEAIDSNLLKKIFKTSFNKF